MSNMIDSDVIEARLAKITHIAMGAHSQPAGSDGPPQQACIMEAVAWIAGEPHSDRPKCVPATIAAAARNLNDAIQDDAVRTEIVRPLISVMFGRSLDPEFEMRRAYIAADHVTRVTAPMLLEAVGWADLAEQSRAIDPIADKSSAQAAREKMAVIREQAWKRRSAADANAAAYAAAYAAADAAADANAAADELKMAAVRDAVFRSTAEMIVRMCEVQ